MRYISAVLFLVALAMPVFAEDGQGWIFAGQFQGSSNSSGLITKIDPAIGYGFSRNVHAFVGLPVYFVKDSSATSGTSNFMSGVGNAYIRLQLDVDREAVNFSSRVEATAPTGDKDKGFSTGRPTVDWTNTISRNFSAVTPFASMGLANTVSDTSFFVRPFTSLGVVSHFDGGAKFHLSPFVDVGASAYAVRASGQQRIFEKTTKQSTTNPNGNREVVGTADLANDSGVSTWLALNAGAKTNFQVGYTRSAGYDLNTVFFGVGFRVGN